jgi:hypothetical protein
MKVIFFKRDKAKINMTVFNGEGRKEKRRKRERKREKERKRKIHHSTKMIKSFGVLC